MPGKVSGAALGIAALGTLLAWSGIKGKKITSSFKDVISGKSPTTATANPIEGENFATQNFGGGNFTGGSVASSAVAKKNQAIAAPMAALYGWGPGTSNWKSLLALWTRESGWNNRIENSTSGAYGIAQALGHGPTNQYPAGPANPPISSATAQIAWGLQYIKDRYGDPNAAEAHENSAGWY